MTDHHRALALREAALPTQSEWQTLVEMARVLVPTGFLPASIKTPEQAVAIILKGRELRVPPMHALSSIVVVQGKPTASAELMLALIYRDHGDDAIVVEESTAEACRVTYRRRSWERGRSFAFTLEDAKRAQLAGKGTWAAYPQAMLRARAISAVARLAFPDSIGGMHTPEELGAPVRVTEDGGVEVAALEALPEVGPSARQAAIKAAISVDDDPVQAEPSSLRQEVEDAAALERSLPPHPDGPVSERTRMLCAGFVDEVKAANPRLRLTLPRDEDPERVWLNWLLEKTEAWTSHPENPQRRAAS